MPPAPHLSPADLDSCLGQKLSALTRLRSHELALLASLEETEEPVRAGTVLIDQDQPSGTCVIVKKGWFVSEGYGPTGGRAIPRIHFPGDIIGLSDLSYQRAVYRTVAKSAAIVCPISRDQIRTVLASYSRLAGLLLCVAMIEQTQHEDRAALHMRNHASTRLALFVLQTLDRLKVTNRHLHDQFHCPLTQMDIGDLLGLSNVHISRTFGQLEDLRMISRHQSFIKVIDREALCKLTGYVDRFQELDLAWLPER